jgi:hypothetical protein
MNARALGLPATLAWVWDEVLSSQPPSLLAVITNAAREPHCARMGARALTVALCTCPPLALRLGSSSDVLDERTRIPAAETPSRALRHRMSRSRRYLSPALGRVHI